MTKDGPGGRDHEERTVAVDARGPGSARAGVGSAVRAVAVVLGGWVGLLAFGFGVSTPSGAERAVARGVYSLPDATTPVFETVMAAGTFWAVLVVAALLGVLRRWPAATGALVAGLATWWIVKLMKVLIERPRPTAALLDHVPRDHAGGWSFPSGHAAVSAALATIVVLLATDQRSLRWLAAVVAAVTALARVHLGVHWPLDVLAGTVVGILAGWATAVIVRAALPSGEPGSGSAPSPADAP